MDKATPKSKNHLSDFHLPDKKSLVVGSIVATIIASTPYLFYLYESVPDVPVWETFLFKYDSKYYGSVLTVAWTLTGKIVPLLLILIWFFTCKHWWYHVLLIPIAMYSYQIFVTLNDDLSYIDSKQLIFLIPIMAIIVPSIYLIRAKIFNKITEENQSLNEIEEEFKISPKNLWGKINTYF